MIDSTSKGLVQSSSAQHHNHMLCTTIDSHSFLPGVLLAGSWAYKGNHVRDSQQQSSKKPIQMKWQREWSICTLFLVPALIKFFLFNLTSSLNMYFNVLRKPTFSTELYGCPVRLRYHTPFFLAVCGYHFWSPWQRWKHVCLVVRTNW